MPRPKFLLQAKRRAERESRLDWADVGATRRSRRPRGSALGAQLKPGRQSVSRGSLLHLLIRAHTCKHRDVCLIV